MKQFQDLYIDMNADVETMIEKITQNLSIDWSRNIDKEKNIGGRSKQYCFDYTGNGFNAGLWLIERDHQLTVTNIVPNKTRQLTIDEYNIILNTFVHDVVVKMSLGYGMTNADVTLHDLLSSESVKKLQSFSNCANKSTGHGHPSDKERWFAFILSMVKNDEYINANELQFFLEELGWDSSSAYELSLDLEYGYAAMKFALQH